MKDHALYPLTGSCINSSLFTQLVRNMTSEDYAAYIRSRIDDDQTHDVLYYEPEFEWVPDKGTAHASIYAPDGAAVAITATINLL